MQERGVVLIGNNMVDFVVTFLNALRNNLVVFMKSVC